MVHYFVYGVIEYNRQKLEGDGMAFGVSTGANCFDVSSTFRSTSRNVMISLFALYMIWQDKRMALIEKYPNFE